MSSTPSSDCGEIAQLFLPSKHCVDLREFGPVAQLVAHLHGMQGVRGSSPLRSTKENLAKARFFFLPRRRVSLGNKKVSRALD